jgi:maleylpyruvate isomerase
VNDVRAWMDHTTKLFLTALAALDDEALDRPTSLPGWTRRHVVAHVHYNAEALRRLAAWAASGVETPMYASKEQRAQEIEQGSGKPVDELRELVASSAENLSAELSELAEGAWAAEVVTAQGRRVPAREIPWLRTREVAVHAVDLGAGVTFADLPDDLVEALLVDVVRKRARSGEGPTLVAWLAGRSPNAPSLGPWL